MMLNSNLKVGENEMKDLLRRLVWKVWIGLEAHRLLKVSLFMYDDDSKSVKQSIDNEAGSR